MLYSQTRRAIRLSSDEDARARSIQRIRELFSSNGYNDKIIDRTIATCTTRTRHDPARHDPTNRTRTRFKKPTTRMILPFIDDKLTTTVEAVIRGSDLPELGVTWTNGCTIKSQLVRSALKPPACPGGARCHACIAGLSGRCHTFGVVNQLTCTLCNKIYIGESGRMVRFRYNEHLRDAKNNRRDSPWGDHFALVHQNRQPDPSTITAKILQVCRSERDRKIAESLHIRKLYPALNINIASWSIV